MLRKLRRRLSATLFFREKIKLNNNNSRVLLLMSDSVTSLFPDNPMRYGTLAKESTIDVLRLIRSENVGPVTFFHLLKRYKTAQAALDAIPSLAARGGLRRPIALCPKSRAETEMEKAELYGAQFVRYGDESYPKLLLPLYGPPPLLSVLGSSSIWQARPTVAMVGARNASANGCNFAKKLAGQLGEAGYSVISGLARGIDTQAHRGALDYGTAAVIAGGIDNIFPPENKALYGQLREQGAVLSENPFGAEPLARHFPARNRIISGMSLGVVVIEAGLKSGTMRTAAYALEQGREVFAVPGSPLDPRARGSNELIRDGATLTEGIDDILPVLRRPGHLGEVQPGFWDDVPIYEPPARELEKARLAVEEKLGPEPVALDTLIEQTGLSIALLQIILLEKELAGMLQRHPGGRVSLVYGGDE